MLCFTSAVASVIRFKLWCSNPLTCPGLPPRTQASIHVLPHRRQSMSMSNDSTASESNDNLKSRGISGEAGSDTGDGPGGEEGEEEKEFQFRDDIILMNKVWMTGRLGKDPVFRLVKETYSLCTWSLAVKREYTRQQRELLPPEMTKVDTDWFKCEIWGWKAEKAARQLKKGLRIGIEGAMGQKKFRNYEGKTIQYPFIKVNSFEVLESRREREDYQRSIGGGDTSVDSGYEEFLPARKNTTRNFQKSDQTSRWDQKPQWGQKKEWDEKKTYDDKPDEGVDKLEQNGYTPLNDIPF